MKVPWQPPIVYMKTSILSWNEWEVLHWNCEDIIMIIAKQLWILVGFHHKAEPLGVWNITTFHQLDYFYEAYINTRRTDRSFGVCVREHEHEWMCVYCDLYSHAHTQWDRMSMVHIVNFLIWTKIVSFISCLMLYIRERERVCARACVCTYTYTG
jgi:hypothetical protein